MTVPNRYGEDTDTADRVHDCRRGWVTRPDDDHPKPCPVCKPHLTRPTEAPR